MERPKENSLSTLIELTILHMKKIALLVKSEGLRILDF